MVIGTRPEIIKAMPVIRELEKWGNYTLVWSGQHFSYEMSRVFFEELKLPEPHVYLDIPAEGDLLERLLMMVAKIKAFIRSNRDEIVAVYALGDTATTLAAGIASVYEGVPFIHDEAGMRSYDLSMPEEVNRRVADAIAFMHFAPTKLAYYNLLMEGADKTHLYLVGSIVVDA